MADSGLTYGGFRRPQEKKRKLLFLLCFQRVLGQNPKAGTALALLLAERFELRAV